jgi:hypothetical protein
MSTSPPQLNISDLSDAGNRSVLMGVKRNARKRGLDPDYNAFAVTQPRHYVMLGNAKPERIAAVKQKYGDLPDEQISDILSLGAVKRNNFGERVTASKRQALRDVATRHYVKIEPDLNSEATANVYITKRLNTAGDRGDTKGIQKWSNMMTEWKDLDGKPETPNNLIIRNKNDPNDLFAIDGLRLVDRTKSVVKRGVYDMFSSKEESYKQRIN